MPFNGPSKHQHSWFLKIVFYWFWRRSGNTLWVGLRFNNGVTAACLGCHGTEISRIKCVCFFCSSAAFSTLHWTPLETVHPLRWKGAGCKRTSSDCCIKPCTIYFPISLWIFFYKCPGSALSPVLQGYPSLALQELIIRLIWLGFLSNAVKPTFCWPLPLAHPCVLSSPARAGKGTML